MKTQIDITQIEWDIIETYLDSQENSDELIMLKEKLSQISNLEEKIAHVKQFREEIVDSIQQSKIKEFHSQLPADEENLHVKFLPAHKSNSRIIWYSIAAVMVVLLGIYWIMANSSTSEKIFAENFKPDIGLPLKMGTTNSVEFYEGMVDYKQGNYKNAIEQWQVLWNEHSENDTLNYFLGVANLAQGNTAKSLEYLGNQEHFIQSIFTEDALYYAALAKIKEGKFEEAKALLKKNPSPRNSKLLKEIEKP